MREHGLVAVAGGDVVLDAPHAVFESAARPVGLERKVWRAVVTRLLFHRRPRVGFEDLLFDLRGQLTVVIVTHNLQQAARISDMTAFFYLGKLVEMDVTNNMFTRPREERTEAYVTGRFG